MRWVVQQHGSSQPSRKRLRFLVSASSLRESSTKYEIELTYSCKRVRTDGLYPIVTLTVNLIQLSRDSSDVEVLAQGAKGTRFVRKKKRYHLSILIIRSDGHWIHDRQAP